MWLSFCLCHCPVDSPNFPWVRYINPPPTHQYLGHAKLFVHVTSAFFSFIVRHSYVQRCLWTANISPRLLHTAISRITDQLLLSAKIEPCWKFPDCSPSLVSHPPLIAACFRRLWLLAAKQLWHHDYDSLTLLQLALCLLVILIP